MKTRICILLLLISSFSLFAQPCTTNNSAGCLCLDGTNDCDLLPNIKVSKDLLLDPSYNFETPGKYELSVSTPNVGHGPLRVNVTDYFLCGTDTIYSPTPLQNCPNGAIPKQLVVQTIFHKHSDGTMTFTHRYAGSMTYHPSHGHMHFDDWGVFTIRVEDPNDPNPLNWQIIGDGAKIGFCLMDYGSCTTYSGHCRDDNNAILTTNAPNYGLGGGNYSCGLTNQGISCGYTDIYDYSLDGMFITIPQGVCNGNYKLVVHVDPHNVLVEENDNDNIEVIDITLTKQSGTNNGPIQIDHASNLICNNTPVVLSLPSIGGTYLWTTGETTNTITVNTPGYYSCVITTSCGLVESDTIHVLKVNTSEPVVTPPNPICSGETATINASVATGIVNWYDNISAQIPIHTGPSFTTPNLFWGTTFFAENVISGNAQTAYSLPTDHVGADYSSNGHNGEVWFKTYKSIILKSTKVYTDTPGERTVEVRNLNGIVVQSKTVNVPSGTSRIILNLTIPPGDWVITTNEAKNIQQFGHNGPRLKRSTYSSSNSIYPVGIINALSIDNSNAGPYYYYYFYDWEVQIQPDNCLSNRTQIVVNVIQGTDPSFSYMNSSFCEQSSGIIPSTINNPGGVFSANNNLIINAATGEIDANSFVAVNSPYTIYYELTSNNCVSMDSVYLVANVCTNNEDLFHTNQVTLFPNPSNGRFDITLNKAQVVDVLVEVFDIQGKRIDDKLIPSGNVQQAFNYNRLSEGVYFIQLTAQNEIVTKKLLIAK